MDDAPAEGRAAPAIVVMGVSASGKSTVARGLAASLGVPWIDADDLHPPANVEKMAAGIPLNDEDRRPWLDEVGLRLADGAASGGVVVACSALKRAYRDRLRTPCPTAAFIHLDGSKELLVDRATSRTDHFMPASLLESQFEALERLEPDERGLVLDVSASARGLADAAEAWVRANG